jgi:hypothetical protein
MLRSSISLLLPTVFLSGPALERLRQSDAFLHQIERVVPRHVERDADRRAPLREPADEWPSLVAGTLR